VETSEKNFLRRKLKFLTVSEFLPIAGDALTRAFSGTGGEGGQTGTQGGGQNANRPQAQPRQDNAATSRNSGGRNSSMGSNSSGSGGSFGGGGGGGLSDPSVSTAPESVLVGRTLLVADNITNSVVVQGPPAGLEIVERLIDQLDTKPDQVLISCVFGQLDISDGWSFGMDYVRELKGNVAGRGGSGGAPSLPLGLPDDPSTVGVDESLAKFSTFAPGSLPSQYGLGVYGLIGNSLHAYLTAKQEDSNFKVLSRPTVFTANNQKGSIISGKRIAVPTNSYSYANSSGPSTNFEYQDVALKLEVIPLVNSNSEITLKIYLTSDDIGKDRPVGTGDSQYQIPDILNRELITTVTVPNNETVVLGGLITESAKDGTTGIPILSRIPGIGPLFGTKSKGSSESELIVFIRPSIVRDSQTMNDAQTDMDSRYNISPDAREFANPPPPEAVPVEEPKPAKKQKSRSGFRPPNR
jgi:type II secretory pathway component GspD/PulD (secretin)